MAVPGFYPNGMPQTNDTNIPEWMRTAINNVSNVGLGGASRVGISGPQPFSTLQDIYAKSLGGAPTMVDEGRINSIYDDAIKAAMQLGSEQIHSGEAERGAAPNAGVAEQQARELGLRVQGDKAKSLLENLSGSVALQNTNLGKLFESGSSPQTFELGYRNTQQDVNQALPPYVQQSNPGAAGNGGSSFSAAGGSAGGGGKGGSGGGGGGGTPWWQTSYGEMNDGEGAKWNEAQPKPTGLSGVWGTGSGAPTDMGASSPDWSPGGPGASPIGETGGLGSVYGTGDGNTAPSAFNQKTGLTWDATSGTFLDKYGRQAA